MEQQLPSQITASSQRQHKAILVRNEAEKQYWDLHEKAQKIINRSEDQSSDGACSSPLPLPLALCFEAMNTTARVHNYYVKHSFPLRPPSPYLSAMNTFATVPRIQPQLLSQAVLPAFVDDQLVPLLQQLAARRWSRRIFQVFPGIR